MSDTIDLVGTADEDDPPRDTLSAPQTPSILAHDSDTEKNNLQEPTSIEFQQLQSSQTKKRRVPKACIPCKVSRAKCSDTRPCSRCIANSKPDDCIDSSLHPKVRPTPSGKTTLKISRTSLSAPTELVSLVPPPRLRRKSTIHSLHARPVAHLPRAAPVHWQADPQVPQAFLRPCADTPETSQVEAQELERNLRMYLRLPPFHPIPRE